MDPTLQMIMGPVVTTLVGVIVSAIVIAVRSQIKETISSEIKAFEGKQRISREEFKTDIKNDIKAIKADFDLYKEDSEKKFKFIFDELSRLKR